MSSTRRFPSLPNGPTRWTCCFAVLLLAGPVHAQTTTPAVSTIVSFASSQPSAAPVFGPDGALYGTTAVGSSVTGGLIYRAEPDGSGIVTLHQLAVDEGYSPLGGLILGRDNRLYGTTSIGTLTLANTPGTVFRILPDGTGFTILHRFEQFTTTNAAGNAINTDGANPETELVQGSDDFLYGVTRNGGPNGTGVVFKVSTEGTGFAVLHAFGPITSAVNEVPILNGDGMGMTGPLLEGSDGYFYGTATDGGPNGNGTIFRLRFDGSDFSVMHAFSPVDESQEDSSLPTNEDGAVPIAGLTDGGDGFLYGVTNLGGEFGNGTLFALDPVAGTLTTLHAFDGFEGARPIAELLLGLDGKLYGTTATGGTNSAGTVTTFGIIFSIGRDGTGFTVLSTLDGSQGSTPSGRLLQRNATTFIGLAQGGGRCGQGTIYQFSLTGATVNGITNCGQRNNSSGGGVVTPGLLLLLGGFGAWRRLRGRTRSEAAT